MTRVLLSGFAAFGGMKDNPTRRLIEAIGNRTWSRRDLEVAGVVLPVTFADSFTRLSAEIERFQPDWVIALGLQCGAQGIRLERIAVNWIEASIPDNNGVQPRGEKIDAAGSDGIFSRLPVGEWAQKLRERNIPVEISNSAGTYVCNYLFYRLLRTYSGGPRVGFVHVPATPDLLLLNTPTIEFPRLLEALESMLGFCAEA